jgi:hypothetical protein
MQPGSYAVMFTSKNAPKGSHYTLVLVAGTKRMFANAITMTNPATNAGHY